MITTPQIPEALAKKILQTAIDEQKASNLLHCLFEGGSVTVDAETGKLVLMRSDLIQAFLHDDTQI